MIYSTPGVIKMPRKARQKSSTGVYHIIKRGINRQDIFQDDEDKDIYLERLSEYKEQCKFKLYAYCLMSNHVHLLIKEEDIGLSEIMKKIGASYVYWYNSKYRRIGHLFQDRYKSEPIEDNDYLLTVVRYIHQNPVKIGHSIDHWTSYSDYLGGDGSRTDTEPILKLFGPERAAAKEKFIEYVNEPSSDKCLDISERKKITDAEGKAIVKKMGLPSVQELQLIDKSKRNKILKELKNAGLSIRQIERLSGVNRGVILKA